jgi:hypothetical protein
MFTMAERTLRRELGEAHHGTIHTTGREGLKPFQFMVHMKDTLFLYVHTRILVCSRK